MWGVIVRRVHQSERHFLFKVEDVRLHGILVTLLAIFMGLVIFMILALDQSSGGLGIGIEPYQLIYKQLMKRSGDGPDS